VIFDGPSSADDVHHKACETIRRQPKKYGGTKGRGRLLTSLICVAQKLSGRFKFVSPFPRGGLSTPKLKRFRVGHPGTQNENRTVCESALPALALEENGKKASPIGQAPGINMGTSRKVQRNSYKGFRPSSKGASPPCYSKLSARTRFCTTGRRPVSTF